GLKYAMRAALEVHRAAPQKEIEAVKSRAVEEYPASKRLKEGACIHCHQVYDFRREDLRTKGKWRLDEVWVYPLPKPVGLSVATRQGNLVEKVIPKSAAAVAGLKAGDVVTRLNDQPIASFADLQHALHLAPAKGSVTVVWQRDGKEMNAKLELTEGWRRTDISWRTSM